MICEALTFLRDQLSEYIQVQSGQEDKVTFMDGADSEPFEFPKDFVTLMLVNVEEDRTMREMPNGRFPLQRPEIDVNLSLLFVCRFNKYEQSLRYLSLILDYFQQNPVFERQQFPTLSPRIGKLALSLTTMPFREQNEVWNALRTSYFPSVLYTVRMLEFRDDRAGIPAADVTTVESEVKPISS